MLLAILGMAFICLWYNSAIKKQFAPYTDELCALLIRDHVRVGGLRGVESLPNFLGSEKKTETDNLLLLETTLGF